MLQCIDATMHDSHVSAKLTIVSSYRCLPCDQGLDGRIIRQQTKAARNLSKSTPCQVTLAL